MKFSKYDKILFFATLITMVLFSLLSDTVVFGVRITIIISLALICFLLFYIITNKDRKVLHAKIQNINQVSLMNPNQYISKAGPVCAGSDTKYEANFLLDDMTTMTFSLSAKQAKKLIKNSSGILTYYGNVFVDFKTEK